MEDMGTLRDECRDRKTREDIFRRYGGYFRVKGQHVFEKTRLADASAVYDNITKTLCARKRCGD